MSKPIFYHTYHKIMWGIIQRHPLGGKYRALIHMRNRGIITEPIFNKASNNWDCFACMAATTLERRCSRCPLLWKGGCCWNDYGPTLYDNFITAYMRDDKERITKIAGQIKRLPLNPATKHLYTII